jgi:phospholipase/carboxylesterase
MIVAIHGMGDRPESFLPAFDGLHVKARVIAPRAPRKYGSGYSWFTYPPKSEASASQEILEAARLVAEAIRAWSRSKPTSGKAIVTGFSQGGFLTFTLAVHFPDDVGAAFPISGGLPSPLVPEKADAAAAPPIFAMHGDADTIVPIAMARTPVERLKSLGFRVELKEFPRVEHTVNAAMWGELEKRIEKALSD